MGNEERQGEGKKGKGSRKRREGRIGSRGQIIYMKIYGTIIGRRWTDREFLPVGNGETIGVQYFLGCPEPILQRL